ncbi:cold shock and DUF1294 domain-containing protein [Paraglaciecola aquimarina]|uniref:Cold shock and DUF1294 domain-containing protein n=1 Tax=Paraglaciecola algarum TaxID=3050085 RepID=A0ABS9D4R3_9ALTE|nr:cold shock and DUF1294 domain-containing protein [Paraglaciecola sp. G1-23]MCF2946809.1 cold shock and DUF1294 domain-containing protein [Paraglaciecola sp. G1-23]
MRYQGKIFNWNDEKGFGFVEPNGGGTRAFVHIKAFKSGSRRPVNGEIIVYELVKENNRGFKAQNIEYSRDVKQSSSSKKVKSKLSITNFFIFVFCVGLIFSVWSGNLPVIILGWYVVMSLITFIVYAWDKSAAQRGGWRTKESTLHLLSLIGGWLGARLAQAKLRHKSSKKEFKRIYWVTVMLNVAGVFWLYTDNGVNFLNKVIVPLTDWYS